MTTKPTINANFDILDPSTGNPWVSDDGSLRYFDTGGRFHRTDGPCYVDSNSENNTYMIHGKYHREDGPAKSYGDELFWFIDGKQYYNNKSFQLAAGISDEDMLMVNLKYGDIK